MSKNVNIKIYKTVILPVVLYGYENWSLTLMEECRLRGLENMLLRKISGPKRDDGTGEWRRLHNKELYDLYFSLKIIRGLKPRKTQAGACSTHGENKCV
jgi:hypothetical protein